MLAFQVPVRQEERRSLTGGAAGCRTAATHVKGSSSGASKAEQNKRKLEANRLETAAKYDEPVHARRMEMLQVEASRADRDWKESRLLELDERQKAGRQQLKKDREDGLGKDYPTKSRRKVDGGTDCREEAREAEREKADAHRSGVGGNKIGDGRGGDGENGGTDKVGGSGNEQGTPAMVNSEPARAAGQGVEGSTQVVVVGMKTIRMTKLTQFFKPKQR